MSTGVIIALLIVALLAIWLIGQYNGLVQLRNKVRNLFSQIDVVLKRRADLIPNLVETVKGYAKHEKETFEDVVNARNGYMSAGSTEDKIAAADKMTQAVSKIFALAEQYPDLKANENFKDLQTQLTETEDKITYSRQFYNDGVNKYQNKIEMFPTNIVAGMFGFKPEPFFEASEQDRKNVEVKF